MEPIKFTINESILEKMKKFYDSQMVPFEENEFLLKAHAIGCDITVDNKYDASFLGQNAIHEAQHWSRNIVKKMNSIRNSGEICETHHIGAAETGSQDYLGPLCIVSCYVDEEQLNWLKSLEINDVDALSNQEIITYSKAIKEKLVYSLLILDNSHYNKMIQEGTNQANIRARLFNQALVNVLQKVKRNVDYKAINQFVSPKTYFNYLKNEVIVVKDLTFDTDAEYKYMAVLASEILSRYAYLQYFASMSKSLKMNLPRGTSTAVDNIAASIAGKYGEKMLTKVAKLNFANTKRVKALIDN